MLERRKGSGRPRVYCTSCRPSKAPTVEQRERWEANRRARYRRDHPPIVRRCEECDAELDGQHRVTCGARSCKDARYRRAHPVEYAAKQARKFQRRKARESGREKLTAGVSARGSGSRRGPAPRGGAS